MPDIKLKTRIQNKYKPLTEWNSLTKGNFIPLLGEVCYAVENGTLYQKIGDGITDFTELEWLYSPAIQSDHEENDETSAAYIKNRLAYTGINQIPEAEQEMGYFSDPDEPAFDCQVVNIESELGQTPESLGLPATMTEIVQCMAAQPYMLNDSNAIDKIKDINNTFSLSVGEPGNIYTFDFDPNNYVETAIEDYIYHVFLSGNPVVANLLLQALEPPEPIVFPTDKDTELEYALVLLVVDLGTDGIAMQPVFIGDTDIYYATNPDAITFSMKHLTEQYIKQIEEKYLNNATKFIEQSDQNEMDSSKQSYIKNRYGDAVIFHRTLENDSIDSDVYYQATLTLGKEYSDGFVIEEEVITHWLDGSEIGVGGLQTTSFDVEINGVKYTNCPRFNINGMLEELAISVNDNYPKSSFCIGNPVYATLTYEELFNSSDIPSSDIQISKLEDNGLPFLFQVDFDHATPLSAIAGQILKIGAVQGDTVEIKITPRGINYLTHVIPERMLPRHTTLTPFIYDTNKEAIMSRTSYSATGVNSFALGEGATATADNAIAIGLNANAYGVSAVAIGSASKSSLGTAINGGCSWGPESFASGTDVRVGGNRSIGLGYNIYISGRQSSYLGLDGEIFSDYSIGLGQGIKIYGNNNFAFGVGSYTGSSITYETTRSSLQSATLPADATLTLSEETIKQFCYAIPEGSTTKVPITSITKDNNNSYLIRFAYDIATTITKITFYYAIPGSISSNASKSVLFGNGMISASNSLVFGDGIVNAQYGIAMGQGLLVSSENQFAIGKYNLSSENIAFVIGNGDDINNRSNALTVDWNGNLKAAGSVETTSVILSSPNGIKFKVTVDDDGILTSTEITE